MPARARAQYSYQAPNQGRVSLPWPPVLVLRWLKSDGRSSSWMATNGAHACTESITCRWHPGWLIRSWIAAFCRGACTPRAFRDCAVLTAGSPGADHTTFWHGAVLPEAVNQLIVQADVVIWDTPPILAAVDATLLAPLADLILLVVAEDQTTTRQLHLAIEQLRQTGCAAPGIVYNKTKDNDYGYYYRSGSQARSESTGRRPVQPGTLVPVRQEIRRLIAG